MSDSPWPARLMSKDEQQKRGGGRVCRQRAQTPARRAQAARTGLLLWPRGRSSRVRPRGAPSRRPARPGVPGTTRYRVSRRSRRTSGTRAPRPPLARPTRSNNHGPRRTPDTARDIRARRAASPAAPVTPLPRRARRSRLTRAARVPVALPLFPPGVFDQGQPARNRVTNHRRDGRLCCVRFRFECRRSRRFNRHAKLSRVPSLTPPPSLYRCRHV